MRSILLSMLGLCSVIFAQLTTVRVDQYVATEYPIAKEGLLANIGPSGAKSSGAKVSVSRQTAFLTSSFVLVAWRGHRESQYDGSKLCFYVDKRFLAGF